MQRDEEDAWQAIVANYGERVLEPHAAEEEPEEGEEFEEPEPASYDDEPEPPHPLLDREERFVPPTPEPQPLPPPDRLAAWIGLIGGPAVLVISVLVGVTLPTWGAWLLVGGFLAGFGYLVLTMRNRPDDPWDDGARV